MWFKQATLYQFSRSIKMDQQTLSEALTPLSFSPCLPSLPSSMGWVSPIDQEGPLVYGNHRFWMICLQFEEKLLPSTVVRQAVLEKIEEIEKKEARTVRGKEKLSIKDEITQTLLPKAFTKKSRVHAFLDLEHRWLVIDSTTPAKVERFMAFLKRALPAIDFTLPETKKPSAVMTEWLKGREPHDFEVGQSGVLQDPQQERRMIRCQHQDLSSTPIQSLLKDGCEITQLAMTWKDQLQFTLTSQFAIRSIKFQEAVIALSKSDYTETPQQRFDADFVIMTDVLTQMIETLYAEFAETVSAEDAVAV